MKIDIQHCARCGGDHDKLQFEPLARPCGEFTHFACCPTNLQPILLKIITDSAPSQALWQNRMLEVKKALVSLEMQLDEVVTPGKVGTDNLMRLLNELESSVEAQIRALESKLENSTAA